MNVPVTLVGMDIRGGDPSTVSTQAWVRDFLIPQGYLAMLVTDKEDDGLDGGGFDGGTTIRLPSRSSGQ